MSKKWTSLAALSLLMALTVIQFQNCAPEGAFEAASMSVDSLGDNGKFEVIKVDEPKVENPNPILTFNAPTVNRHAAEQILTQAFGPQFRAVDPADIETQGIDFGASCSLYSEFYVDVSGARRVAQGREVCRPTSNNFKVSVSAAVSPARAGYIMKACSALSSNQTTLNHFLSKVGSAEERNSYSAKSLKAAYELFYVGKPEPSQTLLDAMKMIGQSNTDPNKGWSTIAYTICASGHWQVL